MLVYKFIVVFVEVLMYGTGTSSPAHLYLLALTVPMFLVVNTFNI